MTRHIPGALALPVCPACQDYSNLDARWCETCGAPLTPAAALRALALRANATRRTHETVA